MDDASVRRYLSTILNISKSVTLTDGHVHPYEVMYDQGRYEPNSQTEGVFSTGNVKYVPPRIGSFECNEGIGFSSDASEERAERMMLLALRCLYVHSGPRTCMDQAMIAGIKRLVLLPVAQPGRTAETRLAEMARIFGGDPRFILGYSLPNTLAAEEVEEDVRRNRGIYGIEVLKVHPNLSGHDLSSTAGLDRVNALLDSSKKNNLPVIIHGGPSPRMKCAAYRNNGVLQNLAKIDFGRTDWPVVIAHAGVYGLSFEEVQSAAIPILVKLLNKHEHLFIDTSSLSLSSIEVILKTVDSRRIIFGSDAFYEYSWKSAVRIFSVIEKIFSKYEDMFARIVGQNANNIYPLKDDGNARTYDDQILPIS